MATFVETFESLKGEMSKLGLSYDEALFEKVSKGLGPALYNNDANKVSCSDDTELDTVRTNFIEGKLGMSDDSHTAIKKVCETMGSSNRYKYRAIFYYLLVKELGAESKY
jgi:hypothetical protein